MSYKRKESWQAEFHSDVMKDEFYTYILHNVRQCEYCKFRFRNPKSLTPEDIADLEAGLELELGEPYVVVPKRKLVHVAPKRCWLSIEEDERRRHSRYQSDDDDFSYSDWLNDMFGNSYERELFEASID